MVNVPWCHKCNNPEGLCECGSVDVPPTLHEALTELFRFLDKAPFNELPVLNLAAVRRVENVRKAWQAASPPPPTAEPVATQVTRREEMRNAVRLCAHRLLGVNVTMSQEREFADAIMSLLNGEGQG